MRDDGNGDDDEDVSGDWGGGREMVAANLY